MNGDDLERLAAEHVLGTLDAGERREAERLLAEDAAFARRVADWQERFAELDADAPAAALDEAMWARIEAGLGRAPEAPQAASVAAPATPVIVPDPLNAFRALWRSLPFWRLAGLAATAAALVLGFALAGSVGDARRFRQELAERARTPVLVAVLIREGGTEPQAVVNAFANGRVELVPLQDIQVPPDRALEVWTLWDRARGPVSIGLLDRARSASLNLENLPRGPNQLFEITLEPRGGSPIGRPTGPILMKGLTAQAL